MTYQDITNSHTVFELCRRQIVEIGLTNRSKEHEDDALSALADAYINEWFKQLKELQVWQASCENDERIPANVLKIMRRLLKAEIQMAEESGQTSLDDNDFSSAANYLAEVAEYKTILDSLFDNNTKASA